MRQRRHPAAGTGERRPGLIPDPHLLVIHFPIVFWLLAGAVEIFAPEGAEWERVRWLALGGGWVGGLVAILTGLFSPAGKDQPILRANHEMSALLLFFVFTVVLTWRAARSGPAAGGFRAWEKLLYRLLVTAGVILVLITGYLGGEIAHG